MTTLNVRWEPAEGRVKEYKVIYAPTAGGDEAMVGRPSSVTELVRLGVTDKYSEGNKDLISKFSYRGRRGLLSWARFNSNVQKITNYVN